MNINFLWITEFPLLEWSDEENRYHGNASSIYHADGRGSGSISTPILGVYVQKHMISYLNGTEIGGGSVRIHQDDIQEKMFEVLGFTKERAYEQFGFLLDAFKYGVPPHAGLAYGLDRLVMLMAKAGQYP